MTALEREREACEAWHGGIYRGQQAEIAQAAWLAAKRASQPVPGGGDALLRVVQKHWNGGWFTGVTSTEASEINRAIAAHISGQGGEEAK